MGLINFVKQGVQQMMITRPPDRGGLIVYKWPDRNIVAHTQLTVESYEVAIFFKNGQLSPDPAGQVLVGAGRHSIDGAGIPILQQWVDAWTNGNVLLSEIYFVNTQPLRNDPVRFGGNFSFVDPGTSERCHPMFHGSLVIRVIDPVAFVVGLASQQVQHEDNDAVLRCVSDKVKSGLQGVLASVLKKMNSSISEFDSIKSDVEQEMMQRMPSFQEIGLQITEIQEWELKLSEEENEKIDATWKELVVDTRRKEAEMKRRQMEIAVNVGERQAYVNMAQNPAYMNYAQAEALMGAGQGLAKGGGGGSAGSIAGLGAQMAIGAGMAGMFSQSFQPAMQYQRVAPAAGGAVCAACQFNNQGGGKFCANCGKPLAPPQPAAVFCTQCGSQNPAGAKFCASCGAQSGAAPMPGAPGAPSAPMQGAPPSGGQYAAAGYPQAPQGYPAPQQGYPQAPQGYPPPGGFPGGQGPQGGERQG